MRLKLEGVWLRVVKKETKVGEIEVEAFPGFLFSSSQLDMKRNINLSSFFQSFFYSCKTFWDCICCVFLSRIFFILKKNLETFFSFFLIKIECWLSFYPHCHWLFLNLKKKKNLMECEIKKGRDLNTKSLLIREFADLRFTRDEKEEKER